jgi:uncharacterized repeat protein (TIGR04052 family)
MKTTIVTIVALAALAGCASESMAPAPTERVDLRFAAMFGDAPFQCGRSYDGIGTTASRVTPTDLRFYVTDVALVDAQGRETPVTLEQDGRWQSRNVAMLDFEDGSGPCAGGTPDRRDRVVGTVPPGTYTGVRFTLGVPFDLNHGDPTTAPSPLNLTAMFWSWQGGYKFLKLDMNTRGLAAAMPSGGHGSSGHGAHRPAATGHGASSHGSGSGGKHDATGYALHLGSTQCAAAGPTSKPTGCANPNRVDVRLPGFDLRRDVVVADLRAVLAGSNVDVNTPNTSPGCMSFPNDPDCMGVMQRLGAPYGGVASTGQTLFSARPAARLAEVP